MIISHKHKFIFVRTRKTASTSLEIFLSGICGEADIITPIYPPHSNHQPQNFENLKFYNHMSALEIRARVGAKVWRDYTTFCVERNPWDKTVSHYYMLKHRATKGLSFEEYFKQGKLCHNFQLYSDQSGRLLVDRVLRYEDLDQELGKLTKQLGIVYSGNLAIRAKSTYRTDQSHYRDQLNAAQASAIRDAFKQEIDFFGYQF